MTRTQLKNVVADLSRELGRSPGLDMISARFSETPSRMKAYLQALVTEGALEADGSGYRISVRAIGPTSQRELFQTSESGGRPRGQSPQGDNHQPAEDTPRFTPEELALIEASAQEENDGRPDIVGDRTEAEVGESRSESQEADAARDRSLDTLEDQGDGGRGPDDPPTRPNKSPLTSQMPQPRQKAQRPAAGFPLGGQWQITSIRIVMAVAGIGAAVVSGYFMILKLSQVMPFLLAALLGSIMVCFSVLAFETVIVFLRRHQKTIASLFIGAWFAIWVFTLLACVSGFFSFYSSILKTEIEQTAPQQINRQQLDLVHERQSDLRNNIAEKRKEIEDLQTLVAQMSTSMADREKYAGEYANAQARLLSREDQLTKLQDDLQATRDQESTLIASTPSIVTEQRSADFYGWLSGITGIRSGTLELIVSMFPALLIDLMASGGLAIALFLEGEKKT